MPLRIKKEKTDRGIKSIVEQVSSVTIDICLQCKRCANGCPVAAHALCSPSEIIKKLQLGAGEELLENEFIWMCASCGTCFSRCPMKIDGSALIDALRVLAEEKKSARPAGNMPLMNKILLGTIKYFGRTYDLGAMVLYKIGTASYLSDVAKIPVILKKGKIALLPPHGADRKKVKNIFDTIGSNKDQRK
jgi:heterodisulfide reductase subunit C